MNSLAETDQAKKTSHGGSDGRENNGPFVSKSMATVKRDFCQQPNLDISLLPPWEMVRPFPYQHKGQCSAWPQQDCRASSPPNVNEFKSPEKHPCAQLTVFYAGKLNVYSVSPDKAKVIMALARTNSYSLGSGTTSSFAFTPSTPLNAVPRCMDLTPITPSLSLVAIPRRTQSSQTMKTAALPIGQKNSILSFIKRRNERIHQKSPYARPAQ